jgi:hypothetical protein
LTMVAILLIPSPLLSSGGLHEPSRSHTPLSAQMGSIWTVRWKRKSVHPYTSPHAALRLRDSPHLDPFRMGVEARAPGTVGMRRWRRKAGPEYRMATNSISHGAKPSLGPVTFPLRRSAGPAWSRRRRLAVHTPIRKRPLASFRSGLYGDRTGALGNVSAIRRPPAGLGIEGSVAALHRECRFYSHQGDAKAAKGLELSAPVAAEGASPRRD